MIEIKQCAQMVANVFWLVQKNYVVKKAATRGKYDYMSVYGFSECRDLRIKSIIHTQAQEHEFEYKSDKYKFPSEDNYELYLGRFMTYTLIDMQYVLYQLVPFASNWVISAATEPGGDIHAYTNTLEHVKIAIKYIESQIKIYVNPELQSATNILVKYNELQNKYDALVAQYANINNMIANIHLCDKSM